MMIYGKSEITKNSTDEKVAILNKICLSSSNTYNALLPLVTQPNHLSPTSQNYPIFFYLNAAAGRSGNGSVDGSENE